MRRMPAARALRNWCSSNGTPAVGSSGLGVEIVSGLSRVPLPPTSRIASSVTLPHQMPGPVSLLFGGALVGSEMRLSRCRPGEFRGTRGRGVRERATPFGVLDQPAERGGDALGVGLGVGDGFAAHLGQRRT